ncbi:Cyclin-A1-2 [Nosema granulosis]|uniref:Cyclin-A1-2 n=1 Tax=Nosema granulosis TaxID=83296 RepID=A0A9P6H465_9MICR|nr:Cyclin-A1-2 [Nosema granulosis]
MKRAFHDITNITRKNIKLTIHKSSHRKKLVRWLYEVVEDFEYSQVTFAMAVYILDRYTVNKGFNLSEYQLIGITVLFIAAKFEEPKNKGVADYVEVTDSSVNRKEILEMEREILSSFGFNLDLQTPHRYLRIWYLEKMDCKFSLEERQEILFCSFAYILEKHTCRHNMYWMYLEGIREAEKVLSGHCLSDELRFYIEHNRTTKNLVFM